MEADFSGWATKAGLKCADGLTITSKAFEHQDKAQVPLVYQHGHEDVTNVLGHAILEQRPEGVYAHCYFNDTPAAQHAKSTVKHGDIKMLSIWANQLIKKGMNVLHGSIKEVSLVLSGANPGAYIENIRLSHGDGLDDETLEDEAIIHTGLEIEHGDGKKVDDPEDDPAKGGDSGADEDTEDADGKKKDMKHSEKDDSEKGGDSGADGKKKDVKHSDGEDGPTFAEVYESMTPDQQQVCHYMIEKAVDEASDSASHSEIDDDKNNDAESGKEGKDTMGHKNVFESGADAATGGTTLSHSDLKDGEKFAHADLKKGDFKLSKDDVAEIIKEAKRGGSLKHAVEAYAEDYLEHGIEDIDLLFPEARNTNAEPEFLKRRTEWVNVILGGVKKSPFSRLKTLWADLTFEEARAKGYVKGAFKKEEFFKAARRITIPTTIYKKQKLDRDDMLDITDFDVVNWLKGEMRIMLDEEVARAILLGDGRDGADEDKVDEEKIRPIATDDEFYTTTIHVNISDSLSSFQEVIDALVEHRWEYRGTGLPIMFTTETYVAKAMLLKDSTGRDLYTSLEELATKLRVSAIVPVEAMMEYDDLVAVLVNPVDYTTGTDRGGEVSMFDFFDIDYNQNKYLIETRMSGALTKLKAALVVKKVAAGDTLLDPTEPTFDVDTGVVTIPVQTGVIYKNIDGDTLSSGAQTAIDPGDSIAIFAYPDTGYDFNVNTVEEWVFTRNSA